MKDKFPGYFKEDKESRNKIWSNSLFVFDANILLNLYRYSDPTRQEFLRIMERLQGKIFLPHRAAQEYLDNRLVVIDQQEKLYEKTSLQITTLKTDLENSHQHPFVSSTLMETANRIFEDLLVELESNKLIHTTRINEDEIKNSIAAIFENCVGHPYDVEKLKEIIELGEERYSQEIPPGFKAASQGGYRG